VARNAPQVLAFSMAMSRWCAQHLRAAPHEKAPPVDFGRPLPPQRVAVSEVVDIEEMVYAPRYGESAPAAFKTAPPPAPPRSRHRVWSAKPP
jgi:hypothetical protein